MARRAKQVENEQTAPTGALSLAVRPSEGVKRAERVREENPTLEAVQQSLEAPQAYDVATEEDAKRVTSLLRRAAQDLGLGLSQSTSQNSDGTWTVDFQANNNKRQRSYTGDDIRAWYSDNFLTADDTPAVLGKGKIPADVRTAYRIANGYEKGSITLLGATFESADEDSE